MTKYSVKTDAFEGPLDLLLHLINRLEVDIYDIPVSEITDQYLNYVHTMNELQLDVASEYLVMAATLLAIKSKMLLPKREELYDEELEMEEGEDPREELMQRLIEYKKYKDAAVHLQELEAERSNVFTRPSVDLSRFSSTEDQIIQPVTDASVYDMISAMQRLFLKKALQAPKKTTINRVEIPIEQRMEEIMDKLISINKACQFDDFFPFPDRDHIVVTFLAILELMKQNKVFCEQQTNFSTITISLKGAVSDDIK
ncbi:segregation/condensation protein A [Lottiidibacillus patelloidae]|uniref:Segregation and condensation protein A n=1 Tax=Lottiidibacillus patelloidae TaxID=2670334 RepID=A0A263BUX2_9BACI|nr:segregation/condensation protein A [Lottiidibacillus patelloidae]OZM57495.1 segregation/condensation protein A [Lottiidibacillus patelloidae]